LRSAGAGFGSTTAFARKRAVAQEAQMALQAERRVPRWSCFESLLPTTRPQQRALSLRVVETAAMAVAPLGLPAPCLRLCAANLGKSRCCCRRSWVHCQARSPLRVSALGAVQQTLTAEPAAMSRAAMPPELMAEGAAALEREQAARAIQRRHDLSDGQLLPAALRLSPRAWEARGHVTSSSGWRYRATASLACW